MLKTLKKICYKYEVILVEFDGESDHVHLLVNYPPKLSVSKFVNHLKGVSSRMMRKIYWPIKRTYWRKGVMWSPSYFCSSCGGVTIATIKKYISNQKTPL